MGAEKDLTSFDIGKEKHQELRSRHKAGPHSKLAETRMPSPKWN